MIGKFIALIMCAAACSAQISTDCGEIDTIIRREPICQGEAICHSEPICQPETIFRVYRAEPGYRCRDDYGQDIVQQRVDSRSFPVYLSNEAPETRMPPVIQAPTISTPVRERPIIRLPHPPIPQERVVSHKCLCTKTVIKPQIIQRVITVPRVQRFLRRGFRPVIENVAYASRAKTCDNFDAPVERIVAEPIPVRRSAPFPSEFSQISSIC